jgi:hypothetical protein
LGGTSQESEFYDLWILEVCVIFLAAPMAVKGLAAARVIGETLILAVVAVVVCGGSGFLDSRIS